MLYLETHLHLWNTPLNDSKNEIFFGQNLWRSKSKHVANAMRRISDLKHFSLFVSVH